jgi:hypothetical protein
LFALIIGAVQVAHDLCNRHQIARVDLLLIFLRTARPHRPLDLCLTLERVQRLGHHIRGRKGAHADFGGLVGGNAQRHLVLFERDHEQFQMQSGNFLFLDGNDLSHAMGRVNHKLVGTELRLLRLGHSGFFLAPPGVWQRQEESREIIPRRPSIVFAKNSGSGEQPQAGVRLSCLFVTFVYHKNGLIPTVPSGR